MDAWTATWTSPKFIILKWNLICFLSPPSVFWLGAPHEQWVGGASVFPVRASNLRWPYKGYSISLISLTPLFESLALFNMTTLTIYTWQETGKSIWQVVFKTTVGSVKIGIRVTQRWLQSYSFGYFISWIFTSWDLIVCTDSDVSNDLSKWKTSENYLWTCSHFFKKKKHSKEPKISSQRVSVSFKVAFICAEKLEHECISSKSSSRSDLHTQQKWKPLTSKQEPFFEYLCCHQGHPSVCYCKCILVLFAWLTAKTLFLKFNINLWSSDDTTYVRLTWKMMTHKTYFTLFP